MLVTPVCRTHLARLSSVRRPSVGTSPVCRVALANGAAWRRSALYECTLVDVVLSVSTQTTNVQQQLCRPLVSQSSSSS